MTNSTLTLSALKNFVFSTHVVLANFRNNLNIWISLSADTKFSFLDVTGTEKRFYKSTTNKKVHICLHISEKVSW